MVIKNGLKQNEIKNTLAINTTSNLIRRAKNLTAAIAVSTAILIGANTQNIFAFQNNINDYIEPIPIKYIHKSGNAIYINGEKFNSINAPTNEHGNGTKNMPYIKFSPLRVEINNINNPLEANVINSNMLSNIKLLYREGPILFSYNKQGKIGSYDGLGYYAFQIAIDLSEVAQAFGNNSPLAERVFLDRNAKKVYV